MPYRKVIFADNQYYHIFNRSVGGESIFTSKKTLARSIDLMDFYRFKSQLSFSKFKVLAENRKREFMDKLYQTEQLVELLAFSLMPNHFHLLLRQLREKGIIDYLSNLQNSLAKYVNIKSARIGSLFCNPFKGVHIQNENLLLHINRYIHLNHVTSYIIDINELDNFPWTSFPYYIGAKSGDFVSTDLVLSHFANREKYREFVYNQADYQRQLHTIKHLLLE